jgi:putative membrane protein insertion efficiency factor
VIRHLVALPIVVYRRLLSPLKPRCCRFEPSCSQYALDALRQRGVVVGLMLTAWRLLRCHPFCEPGHDPVPEPGRPWWSALRRRGKDAREGQSRA